MLHGIWWHLTRVTRHLTHVTRHLVARDPCYAAFDPCYAALDPSRYMRTSTMNCCWQHQPLAVVAAAPAVHQPLAVVVALEKVHQVLAAVRSGARGPWVVERLIGMQPNSSGSPSLFFSLSIPICQELANIFPAICHSAADSIGPKFGSRVVTLSDSHQR